MLLCYTQLCHSCCLYGGLEWTYSAQTYYLLKEEMQTPSILHTLESLAKPSA